MEAMKCQLNNIVSTPNAKAATADALNMCLGSDLPESEHIRFRSDLIPQAIKDHCGLGLGNHGAEQESAEDVSHHVGAH